MSAAADRGNNRNFALGSERAGETAGVVNIFFAYKNIDVLPDVSLLGGDTVAQAGVKGPENRQMGREKWPGLQPWARPHA